MKTLGIIGGIGPESTIDYYRSIIALFKQRTGAEHQPPILIQSMLHVERIVEELLRS